MTQYMPYKNEYIYIYAVQALFDFRKCLCLLASSDQPLVASGLLLATCAGINGHFRMTRYLFVRLIQ